MKAMKNRHGWVIGMVILAGMLVAVGEETPAWREKFDQVYRLEDEEVLRRIPPPFIPERMDYYRIENSSQAQQIPKGPDYFCFHWTGQLRKWASGFLNGNPLTLAGVLESVLDLENFEFEGPKQLLSAKLAGDWIVNPDVEREKKLEALAGIFEKATKRKIEFVPEKVEREVVVAGGDWTFDCNNGKGTVHLRADESDPNEGGGGGSGTMDAFFNRLGSLINLRVVDETTTKAPQNFQWRTHHSSYVSRTPAGAQREEKVKKLLEVASEQTGVSFVMEKREVEVWMVREKK